MPGLPLIALMTLVSGAAVGSAFFATASNRLRFVVMVLVIALAGLATMLLPATPGVSSGKFLVGAIAAVPAVMASVVAIILAPAHIRRRPRVIVAATVGAALSVPVVAMAVLASGCLLIGACL